jgi:hypothetical protein
VRRLFSIVGSVALGCALFALPTSASTASDTVICKDGASSPGGRGACKGHGGIDKKATKAAATTAAAAAAATTSKSSAAADSASGDTVTCKDGTTSKAGKGACSHHGGKAKGGHATGSAAPAKPATTSSAPASPSSSSSHAVPATAKGDNANAEGATAKCKDGTFSHSKKHSGSCSHHGGVAEFLDK